MFEPKRSSASKKILDAVLYPDGVYRVPDERVARYEAGAIFDELLKEYQNDLFSKIKSEYFESVKRDFGRYTSS